MGSESPQGLLAASLIDPLAIPAVYLEASGVIIHHNTAWVDWISHDPTPAFGPNICSLIHPQQRDAFLETLDNPSRDSRAFQTTHQNKSIWVTTLRGTENWNSGTIGVMVPSRSCDLLPEGHHPESCFWSEVMENLPNGFWSYDRSVHHIFRSEAWYDIRGLSKAESSGVTIRDHIQRIHPADLIAVSQAQRALLRTGSSDVQFRERHADGHWIAIRSQARVTRFDADRRPVRLIGTDTDVSHFKKLRRQYDEMAQRLELAIETSGIGVWEFNLDTQETVWDHRVKKMYGISAPNDQASTTIWEDALHPDDYERVTALSSASIRDRNDTDMSYRIVRPDNTIRYIRSTGRHYTDEFGVDKFVGVNWDITREHEQAAALRAANLKTKEQNKALEAARAKMEYQSNHDALTGLPNRRMLDNYRKEAKPRRLAKKLRSAVLHIDLDRFKQINDTLGHAAGDAVLRHVAKLLRQSASPNSIIARVGGDEFVIFIDHAPYDAMLGTWARDIIKQAKRPFFFEGHECRYGISIGIATDDHVTSNDSVLFANADLALYQAKDEGRGTMRFYSDNLKVAAEVRRECADDILLALEKGQFKCVYQPQYDCKTREIIGAESLVRWDHPTRGRLAPDAFLNVAEDLGIVAKIDQVVFERARTDALRWRANGKYVPQISVNVSAKRLFDPLLPMRIAHVGQEEQKFAFELLESVFLDDPNDNLSRNLACIREQGIAIEVDDFGTGHASMVGLLNLRPDRLKIDSQLVMPLVRSQQQRQLVASIIEIGHVLGIAVVAEGVETLKHADALTDLGCDFLQGYGLARPMEPDDLEALLPNA